MGRNEGYQGPRSLTPANRDNIITVKQSRVCEILMVDVRSTVLLSNSVTLLLAKHYHGHGHGIHNFRFQVVKGM